jgi:hypothetical protein
MGVGKDRDRYLPHPGVENLGCADEGDLGGVDPFGQRAAAAAGEQQSGGEDCVERRRQDRGGKQRRPLLVRGVALGELALGIGDRAACFIGKGGGTH